MKPIKIFEGKSAAISNKEIERKSLVNKLKNEDWKSSQL